jgi:PAS domain S-box-containing protein
MIIGGRADGRRAVPLLGLVSLLALGTVLLPGPIAAAAGPEQHRLVVVLYPNDNDGRPGNLRVDRGIRSAFAAGSAENVEVHSEYLDLSAAQNAGYPQHLAEFLRRKYTGRKIDLVIAGLAPALDFALKYREEIFPGVPIVFCAIDRREVTARRLPPDVIGVPIEFDLPATLDLALRLHPGTRRVYVVAGKAAFDAHWEAEARQIFRSYEPGVEFVYLTGLPLEDLVREVDHLPDKSIIYYLHVFEDGAGKTRVPADVLEAVAARANAPVYGHVDTYVGRGLVGGRAFSFEAAGKSAAGLGLRLLAGEKPETLSVQEASANTYLFDWRQLRRWGIPEESLPPDSDVRYREPGFWDLYRWHIIGVFSLCIIEGLLIVGLLTQRVYRRRADRRFRLVIEAAPDGMLMVGPDGAIVLANAQLEKLFGYRKEEMLGQAVEMLLPERNRAQHPLHRTRFFGSPEIRPMGAGRDLFGRRKDGTEFPVQVGLSPVRTDTGHFVLASVIDISDRKQALDGLRESQHELRVLTGRLLQAQETERRRIARELHDDLNQSLALLSVELDVLSHKPSEPAAQFRERMQELSARVKQLSSAVHDLSHQLHPAKLEQLGLLATVRGLCKELTQSHGLPIEFSHHDVPAALPEDASLCLYRVVQEALRNVIKHSGARHAEVELSGRLDAIGVRIVDDGAGFDPGSVPGKGRLGLVSMRERLRLVRGTITIGARPSGGTRIEASVPLGETGQPEDALQEQPARIG